MNSCDKDRELEKLPTADYETALQMLGVATDEESLILDVGAGIGRISLAAERLALRKTKIILLDLNYSLNPTMRKQAIGLTHGKSALLTSNAYKIPLADKEVDYSVLMGSGKDLPFKEKQKLLNEILRVTRKKVLVDDRLSNQPNEQAKQYCSALQSNGYPLLEQIKVENGGRRILSVFACSKD